MVDWVSLQTKPQSELSSFCILAKLTGEKWYFGVIWNYIFLTVSDISIFEYLWDPFIMCLLPILITLWLHFGLFLDVFKVLLGALELFYGIYCKYFLPVCVLSFDFAYFFFYSVWKILLLSFNSLKFLNSLLHVNFDSWLESFSSDPCYKEIQLWLLGLWEVLFKCFPHGKGHIKLTLYLNTSSCIKQTYNTWNFGNHLLSWRESERIKEKFVHSFKKFIFFKFKYNWHRVLY